MNFHPAKASRTDTSHWVLQTGKYSTAVCASSSGKGQIWMVNLHKSLADWPCKKKADLANSERSIFYLGRIRVVFSGFILIQSTPSCPQVTEDISS